MRKIMSVMQAVLVLLTLAGGVFAFDTKFYARHDYKQGAIQFSTSSVMLPVASGDLDGDSDIDGVTTAQSAVVVLKNIGNGTFGGYSVEVALAAGNEPWWIVIADLYGDGDGNVNVADPVYMINFVFKNGPKPYCP